MVVSAIAVANHAARRAPTPFPALSNNSHKPSNLWLNHAEGLHGMLSISKATHAQTSESLSSHQKQSAAIRFTYKIATGHQEQALPIQMSNGVLTPADKRVRCRRPSREGWGASGPPRSPAGSARQPVGRRGGRTTPPTGRVARRYAPVASGRR